MHGTDIHTLARLPLLRGSNRRQLMLVDRLTTAIELPPERVLCEQGEPGQHFYVMLKGRAAVMRDGRLVALLGRGDWFGEMAFVAPGPAAHAPRSRPSRARPCSCSGGSGTDACSRPARRPRQRIAERAPDAGPASTRRARRRRGVARRLSGRSPSQFVAFEVLQLDHEGQHEADVRARERVVVLGAVRRARVHVDDVHAFVALARACARSTIASELGEWSRPGSRSGRARARVRDGSPGSRYTNSPNAPVYMISGLPASPVLSPSVQPNTSP